MIHGKWIPAKTVALITLSIAIGAGLRAAVAIWGKIVPFHWAASKFGLTETLTFVSGFVFGSTAGFVTGAGIIAVADIAMGWAGAWTPFIAAIIGLLGIMGGLVQRAIKNPGKIVMGLSAIGLTAVSEILQNLWFSWFFGIPFFMALVTGIPSITMAFVNNFIFFTTVGPFFINLLKKHLK